MQQSEEIKHITTNNNPGNVKGCVFVSIFKLL